MTNTSIQAQSTSIGGVNPTPPPPLVAILSPTALKLCYIRVCKPFFFFFILATVSMGIQNLLQQVCTSKIIQYYFIFLSSISSHSLTLSFLSSLSSLFFFSSSLTLCLRLFSLSLSRFFGFGLEGLWINGGSCNLGGSGLRFWSVGCDLGFSGGGQSIFGGSQVGGFGL